jgi:hypothetical protein
MPNPAAVTLIAARLPNGLVHPGDGDKQPAKLIPLPGLSNLGLPQGMAEHFAKEAGMPSSDVPQRIAEAIVHTLETDGDLELVPRAELEQLRAQAATLDDVNPNAPVVIVRCGCNTEPILQLSIGRPLMVIDGKALRARLDAVCGCN